MTVTVYVNGSGEVHGAWDEEAKEWRSIDPRSSESLAWCIHCEGLYDMEDATIGLPCSNPKGHSYEGQETDE